MTLANTDVVDGSGLAQEVMSHWQSEQQLGRPLMLCDLDRVTACNLPLPLSTGRQWESDGNNCSYTADSDTHSDKVSSDFRQVA